MRVLISGDREWTDKKRIREYILSRPDVITYVIEGEARGADTLAREVANELGIRVMPFPANWKRYGRGAGPKRNQQMLDEGKPDEVCGFHDDIRESKGTRDMLRRALAAGIKTLIVSHAWNGEKDAKEVLKWMKTK